MCFLTFSWIVLYHWILTFILTNLVWWIQKKRGFPKQQVFTNVLQIRVSQCWEVSEIVLPKRLSKKNRDLSLCVYSSKLSWAINKTQEKHQFVESVSGNQLLWEWAPSIVTLHLLSAKEHELRQTEANRCLWSLPVRVTSSGGNGGKWIGFHHSPEVRLLRALLTFCWSLGGKITRKR